MGVAINEQARFVAVGNELLSLRRDVPEAEWRRAIRKLPFSDSTRRRYMAAARHGEADVSGNVSDPFFPVFGVSGDDNPSEAVKMTAPAGPVAVPPQTKRAAPKIKIVTTPEAVQSSPRLRINSYIRHQSRRQVR